MAANYSITKVYPYPPQVVMNELRFPRTHSMLDFTFESEQPWLMQFNFKHGVSFTSWGEKITIKMMPVGENQTSVEIRSECALPTQVIDWGKNKENVERVVYHLDTYLIQQANVGKPANQAVPGSAALRCSSCGLPLPPTARFCSRCGKPVSGTASE